MVFLPYFFQWPSLRIVHSMWSMYMYITLPLFLYVGYIQQSYSKCIHFLCNILLFTWLWHSTFQIPLHLCVCLSLFSLHHPSLFPLLTNFLLLPLFNTTVFNFLDFTRYLRWLLGQLFRLNVPFPFHLFLVYVCNVLLYFTVLYWASQFALFLL